MLESEIYEESLMCVVVDEVYCVTEWGSSSNNKIVQLFVLFVGYFRDSGNFNYAILMQGDLRHHYGISGSESHTSVFAFRTK